MSGTINHLVLRNPEILEEAGAEPDQSSDWERRSNTSRVSSRGQSAEARVFSASEQNGSGQSSPAGPAVLQAKELNSVLNPKQIRETAGQGLSGQSQQLPHLERIKPFFGAHDLSQVQAHVGGAATTASEAIGAEAYASGNQIAFKANPSLHTVAHEAAHIVQQRAGVNLQGGVGKSGDDYEKHADAVAEAVVQGRDAAPLLGGQCDVSQDTTTAPVQLKKDGKKVVSGAAMTRLGHAEDSIKYTKGILKFGAGNQIEALQNSKFNSNFRLHVARKKKYWSLTPEAKKVADADSAAYRAARAEMAQGGNCGEHANLAYQYLRHKAVGEEIARGNVSGFDHAFTFVGPSGGEKDMSQTAVSDPWPTAPKAVLWEDHFAMPVMEKPSDLQTHGNMVADGGNPKDLIKKGLSLSPVGLQIINQHLTEKETTDKIDKHEDERAEKAQLQSDMEVLSEEYFALEAQLKSGNLKDEDKKSVEAQLRKVATEYNEKQKRLKEIKIWMWGQVNAHEDGHDYEYVEEKKAPAPAPAPAPEPEPAWMTRMWNAISGMFA